MKFTPIDHLKLRARTTKTNFALALLGELADAAGYFAESTRPYRFVPGTRRYYGLQTLRQQKLVQAKRVGDRLEITITTRGIARIKLEEMRKMRRKLPNHTVVLVMFDFPETEHARRNLWRRYLKWFGFTQVQKSVWQIKYDIGADMVRFVHAVGAHEWIKVFTARQVTTRH